MNTDVVICLSLNKTSKQITKKTLKVTRFYLKLEVSSSRLLISIFQIDLENFLQEVRGFDDIVKLLSNIEKRSIRYHIRYTIFPLVHPLRIVNNSTAIFHSLSGY